MALVGRATAQLKFTIEIGVCNFASKIITSMIQTGGCSSGLRMAAFIVGTGSWISELRGKDGTVGQRASMSSQTYLYRTKRYLHDLSRHRRNPSAIRKQEIRALLSMRMWARVYAKKSSEGSSRLLFFLWWEHIQKERTFPGRMPIHRRWNPQ